MPEVKLTGETILLVIAAIVVIAEIISALAKGKESWGILSGKDKMQKLESRVQSLETDMAECQRRLGEGDNNIKGVRKDLAQVMDVLDGILLHFISGNDKETLKKVKQDLDHYKSRRGTEGEDGEN